MPRKRKRRSAVVEIGTGPAKVRIYTIIHVSAKHITRIEFTPDERHITSEQAVKIKGLIDELVDMDVSASKDQGRSYARWWKTFNNGFKITTYRELPREFFDEALLYLRQAKAQNLPKIRRKDNELWRRKHYGTIFGIAKKSLEWNEDDVHQFASEKLKKRITSLTDIGEQDLARLARWIRAESKKK